MLRVLDSTGSGYVSDTVDAMNYAASHGARIFSASLGAYLADPSYECAAVAAHPNTLFVFAAGNDTYNDDYTPFYPASCPSSNVISVAASDQSDWSASFSNYGPSSVDVAAPGTNIYSTIPSGWLCGGVASIYCWLAGTSMATPHVAGEAALLAAKYPTWTAAQIKARIMATVEQRGNWAGRVSSGGRVNAGLALAHIPQCSDGIDNDGDGLVDYPNDAGCSSPSDDSEYAPPTTACSDGADNDGDGLIDYPRDPGCSSPSDTDEYNAPPPPKPACSDGIDNDGDRLVDYPRDPGCTSASDTNEYNAPPPARDAKPRLTRVHLSTGSFPVRVYWTQNQTATITVTVAVKSRGHWRTVRTLTLRNATTGARSVRVARGSFKRGTYRFSLNARDKAGAASAVAGYKTIR
jgi:subtilisin family serine protease